MTAKTKSVCALGRNPQGVTDAADAATGHTAEPEGGQRLHDLVAGRRSVGERVDERQQAIAAVRGRERHRGADRADRAPGTARSRSRVPAAKSIEKVMQPSTMAVPRSGCLTMSTAATAMNESSGRTKALHWSATLGATSEHVGGEDDHGQLHQLGGLDLDRPDPDPPARTAGEVTDPRHEHHDQEAEGDEGQHETKLPDARPTGVRLTTTAALTPKPM